MINEAQVPTRTEMKTGGAVMAFVPQNYEEAWRLANTIVKADMAPAGLKSAEKVMVAIMHGQEVGFTPMAALQSIAVINGRPTIWGDGALGLVQGSGKMEWIKEAIEGEGDARAATCIVKRSGDKEPKTGTFSVADAKAAGLWKKAGPWTQYPDRMLKMRARSWALRDGFSDVLKGLGVTEEVQDFTAQEVAHTVVSSGPLAGEGAPVSELRMPSVKAAAEPEPVVIADPGPGVVYLDYVTNVLGPYGKKDEPQKYGIQTKTLGPKKLLGTYDEALVSVAKQAKESGVAVELSYSHEDGRKPALVSIVVMPA